MQGLEVLYSSVVGNISCPQDAIICFVHWEIIRSGNKCVGCGDQPLQSDKKSELLPAGWNDSKELYTLRYKSKNDESDLLLKAITVDDSLIFNIMDSATERVSDFTVNVSDYVDAENLREFDRAFKNSKELAKKVQSELLPPHSPVKSESSRKAGKRHSADPTPDRDPLLIPPRNPHTGRQPYWPDPLAPFATGGADLDPLGGRGSGGMILDPLRSGFPRPGVDPSAGIPGQLPRGAVPPGARFDPFGPVGHNRPGPDPDHLPPPGYDDMFM